MKVPPTTRVDIILRKSRLNLKRSLPFTIFYLSTMKVTLFNAAPPELHTHAIRTTMVTSSQTHLSTVIYRRPTPGSWRGTPRWPITSVRNGHESCFGIARKSARVKIDHHEKNESIVLTNSKTKQRLPKNKRSYRPICITVASSRNNSDHHHHYIHGRL
jgi:hypothetical protein